MSLLCCLALSHWLDHSKEIFGFSFSTSPGYIISHTTVPRTLSNRHSDFHTVTPLSAFDNVCFISRYLHLLQIFALYSLICFLRRNHLHFNSIGFHHTLQLQHILEDVIYDTFALLCTSMTGSLHKPKLTTRTVHQIIPLETHFSNYITVSRNNEKHIFL